MNHQDDKVKEFQEVVIAISLAGVAFTVVCVGVIYGICFL